MHPGNILVRISTGKASARHLFRPRPHVIFLDVGMTAELSQKDRATLLEFFKAVALRDGRIAAECTLRLSKQQNCPNRAAFIEVLILLVFFLSKRKFIIVIQWAILFCFPTFVG